MGDASLRIAAVLVLSLVLSLAFAGLPWLPEMPSAFDEFKEGLDNWRDHREYRDCTHPLSERFQHPHFRSFWSKGLD